MFDIDQLEFFYFNYLYLWVNKEIIDSVLLLNHPDFYLKWPVEWSHRFTFSEERNYNLIKKKNEILNSCNSENKGGGVGEQGVEAWESLNGL